jgi:PAS domain S-box-containing protein
MPLLTSLKRVLTLNFLLVASVPVLLFGLLNIQLLSQQQLEGVRERNMMQARSVSEEVESFLLEVRSDLLQVEQTIASGKILQPASVDAFLTGMVRNSQFFESIYLLDSNHQIVHLGILPKLQSRRDDYARLDFSGHQLFQLGNEIKGPVWSNTFVSLVTGEPSVTLGIPMSQGFLLGNIRLSSLGKLLQRYSTHGGVEVSIVDNSGTLVAHNIVEMAMQRVNFADHPTVVAAMKGMETTQEFEQGTRHYLESATLIPTPEWVVWVGLDMNKVMAPIYRMRSLLIGFMVVAAILASLLAFLNVRRLMRPLNALGERTRQIADGDYELDLPPSGLSEIDTLASQITNMSHAIKIREESIVTNEQRFRGLVNSIDGIVWEMEYPSFHFLFVSRQAEVMLGYPVQDWYEDLRFWEEKIHPEDLAQVKAYCQLMAEKHEDHDFEYRMVTAAGKVVWVRNLVTVVVENNRPVRLLGVMIDVTAQKELIDALSHSEQNYREIFNSTSDAIFVHDAETGRVIDVNQAMLNMFQCSYEEALVADLDAFSQGESPYAAEDAVHKLQDALENGSSAFEWRSRKATGELFWSEVNLRSAVIGNHNRVLAAVRDISERKKAAENLHEVNERLSLLINRMPLGCILWTLDFTVNMWNPAAEAIFGFSESEMLGKGPYGKIVPEDIRPVLEPLWTRMRTGDNSAHSLNDNVTKDGKIITCEWSNTPMNDGSGEIIGVISMVQDISERKAAESELEKYRAHLEELVTERTSQLQAAQEELIQKGRLAVLGQLTATVSHEIRNPLGTVANALYLLKDSLAGEEHAHLARPLELAERNVVRCDNIISDLLDFSRQRTIEKEPLKIDAWFAELLDEISFPDEVQCHWDLTSQATVLADSERLRRVMVNVITNALQALAEISNANKRVEIQTRIVDSRCEILICDNGSGMCEEVMSRIFEPMFSTKNFGVGLGVPIIKNIMDGHGGGVHYRSKPNIGTTVTMWLPHENGGPG